jgi:hypothetical protein
MIVDSPNFCLKLLYALDRHFQRFLSQVAKLNTVASAHVTIQTFLEDKAERLIEHLANGIAPSLILLASLLKPPTQGPPTDSGVNRGPKGRENKESRKPKADAAMPATNPEVQPQWKLPAGAAYQSMFSGPSPNLGGWPTLTDTPRLKRAKAMCIRYQAVGTCRQNCFLAHTIRSGMAAKDAATIDARFKAIYGPLTPGG